MIGPFEKEVVLGTIEAFMEAVPELISFEEGQNEGARFSVLNGDSAIDSYGVGQSAHSELCGYVFFVCDDALFL